MEQEESNMSSNDSKITFLPFQRGQTSDLIGDFKLLSLPVLSSFTSLSKEVYFLPIKTNPTLVLFILSLFLLQVCSSGIFMISFASSVSSLRLSILHKHAYLSTIQKQK